LSKTEKLVEVYTARTEMEAEVIKGLLESFGIPSCFKSNAAPSVHWFTMDGMGEVRVMVLDSMAEEARKLIEDSNPDNIIEDSNQDNNNV
jgi:hypothetical protein